MCTLDLSEMLDLMGSTNQGFTAVSVSISITVSVISITLTDDLF